MHITSASPRPYSMKQRITYLVPEGTGIDPSSIVVEPHSLEFKNARLAALEKRVTVGLSELPQEVRRPISNLEGVKLTTFPS